MIDDLQNDDFDKFVTPAKPARKQREFRTDRNNNPIAAAVTTGGRNQFTDALDQAEIPWEHGDPFPGNPKLSTIRIKGDPYEGARAILGNSNALKWYRGTTGKQILPKYGVRSSADFLKLPIDHQNDIINGIYQSEGGRGTIKPTEDDFDRYVSRGTSQATPQSDDDFDKFVTQPQKPLEAAQVGTAGISQPKTSQVTSSVREADTKTELPVEQPLAPVKPIDFVAGNTTPRKAGPTELMMQPFDEAPKGSAEEQLVEGRYKTPPSTELAQAVKIPFSPHLNPSEDDLVRGYLNALGPEYVKYGEKYKQETGRNILSLQPGDVDRDPDGSAYVKPTRAAVDILNAYVKSGGGINAAKTEGARIAAERRGAVTTAEQQAAPDITEVEKIRKEQGAESAAERSLTAPAGRVTADTHKLIGGIASLGGLVPNNFSDYMNQRGEVVRQGASLPPLTEAGQEIQRSIPEKIATAAADTGLSIAQLILMKKATRLPLNSIMAIETGLKNTDKPALERAKDIAESYAMGSALEAHLDRATATALFAVPTGVESAQQVARGQMSKEDAILNTMIQGGVGAALSGGGERERPIELGIERAPVVGVPGEATANIDQRLAEREAAIKPVTDPQGNVLLNPDEVAQGGKPKIKLANQPTAEPAHLANFRERAPDGTFVEGAAKIPEEFKPENVSPQPTEQPDITVPVQPADTVRRVHSTSAGNVDAIFNEGLRYRGTVHDTTASLETAGDLRSYAKNTGGVTQGDATVVVDIPKSEFQRQDAMAGRGERENGTIPSENIVGAIVDGKFVSNPKYKSTTVSPTPQIPAGSTAEAAPTAPFQGGPETKPSRLARGVEAKAVAANLTRGFEGLPEYGTVKVADQAEKAVKLLDSNPEQARRIAMGTEQPPAGLLPESVFTAVENRALERGDVDTIRDLATLSTRSVEASGMGQRIRMLAERNPNSAVSAIRDVQLAREARVAKKFGNIEKARNKVKSEIQIEVKRALPKGREWISFLDEIACK